MANFREIDKDYYARQNSEGASWVIIRAWPNGQEKTVAYYNVKTTLLDWTDAMEWEDKPWIEDWIRNNLTSQ